MGQTNILSHRSAVNQLECGNREQQGWREEEGEGEIRGGVDKKELFYAGQLTAGFSWGQRS